MRGKLPFSGSTPDTCNLIQRLHCHFAMQLSNRIVRDLYGTINSRCEGRWEQPMRLVPVWSQNVMLQNTCLLVQLEVGFTSYETRSLLGVTHVKGIGV